MVWTVLMAAAVWCQILGPAYLHYGVRNDCSWIGLFGAALILLAPFLFYAAGNMGVK